jgi:hypothetical protein
MIDSLAVELEILCCLRDDSDYAVRPPRSGRVYESLFSFHYSLLFALQVWSKASVYTVCEVVSTVLMT